jgi:hypothetical protein
MASLEHEIALANGRERLLALAMQPRSGGFACREWIPGSVAGRGG